MAGEPGFPASKIPLSSYLFEIAGNFAQPKWSCHNLCIICVPRSAGDVKGVLTASRIGQGLEIVDRQSLPKSRSDPKQTLAGFTVHVGFAPNPVIRLPFRSPDSWATE